MAESEEIHKYLPTEACIKNGIKKAGARNTKRRGGNSKELCQVDRGSRWAEIESISPGQHSKKYGE